MQFCFSLSFNILYCIMMYS